MGRPLRAIAGGVIYHVLNRANAGGRIFETSSAFSAFERILEEANERIPARVLAYCLMPNHWHLVICPVQDGDLPRFVSWLTLTHTQRWHAYRGSTGSGHLYQGRYKSFPVQNDGHFLTVCRYVERNALRGGLVARAEEWRWSSLSRRMREPVASWLAPWPIEQPADWLDWVNQPQTAAELESLRRSVQRGQPFGSTNWTHATANTLRLSSTLRQRGRPLKRLDEKKVPDPISHSAGKGS